MPRKSLSQLIRDADDVSRIVTGHRLHWWGRLLWDNLGPGPAGEALNDTVSDDDPYQVLGLHAGARTRVVRAAYRQLAQVFHPDHGGNPAEFQKIQAAYERILKERQEQ